MLAKSRKGRTAGGGAENIIDTMTGEDDALEIGMVGKSRGSGQERPWSAFKKHVLEPSGSHEGVRADVFVCTDVVDGTVPPEVERVFGNISARSQFERARLCYQRAMESKAYDFYVKVRPDFLFLQDFPNVAPMRRDRIHARFREAIGIPGLTSQHFSWDQCGPLCNGQPDSAVGYTDDDMVFVVPGAIADRVFVSDSERQRLRDQFKPPANWLEAHNFPETWWTEQLLAAGVETEPLAITGYPVNSGYDHHKAMRCVNHPSHKTKCGTSVTQHGSE